MYTDIDNESNKEAVRQLNNYTTDDSVVDSMLYELDNVTSESIQAWLTCTSERANTLLSMYHRRYM